MNRIEVETKLNDGRNWLLTCFRGLSDEQLRHPLTPSEHDPDNKWSALDHFAHLALIEDNFVSITRRHIAGHTNPVAMLSSASGAPRTREEIMATVHEMTEKFQIQHHHDTFDEVVALTAKARSGTLALLSELSNAQIAERIPGAPWSDGTVGGVLGVNADHGRSHWGWLVDAGVLTI